MFVRKHDNMRRQITLPPFHEDPDWCWRQLSHRFRCSPSLPKEEIDPHCRFDCAALEIRNIWALDANYLLAACQTTMSYVLWCYATLMELAEEQKVMYEVFSDRAGGGFSMEHDCIPSNRKMRAGASSHTLTTPNLFYVTLKSWASLSSSSIWDATKHLKSTIKGHSRVQVLQTQASLTVPSPFPNCSKWRSLDHSHLLYKCTWRWTILVEALFNSEDHCWRPQHRNWVHKSVLTLQESNSLYHWRRNPTQRTSSGILTSARDWKLWNGSWRGPAILKPVAIDQKVHE